MKLFFYSRFERISFVIVPVLYLVLMLPPIRRFFLDLGWRWLYILSVAFTLSFSLTPIVRWIAHRLNVVDTPGGRKIHTAATPLLGGSAVFIGFALGMLTNGIYSPMLAAILKAALALFLIGVIDDLHDVPAWCKLVVQLGCTIYVVASGVVLRVVPIEMGAVATGANTALTVLWIIGITNAVNFFDGMDGLATGIGAIISFFLGIVAFQTDQPFIGWIAVAMMGGCLGFMPYNLKINGRATIFLGDAGSTVLGFVLACVAVYGDWADNNPIGALAPPLLIFWVLIFDMVHISVDRVLTGKVSSLREWIDYVGNDHLHHRLGYALGSPKRSVLFIFLLGLCLGTSAVVLRDARPIDAALLLLQAAVLVALITILERRGRAMADTCRPGETGRSVPVSGDDPGT